MAFNKFPARFGGYILLDRLASGGMAEVFRAKAAGAEELQRLVAIKCMRPDLLEDELFVPMFVDEAKLAAQLSHANIVHIFELGRVDKRLYIAMELVWGRDLKHLLGLMRQRGERVPLPVAAYVVAKTAEALDYAHHLVAPDGRRRNIIHRDVSPQNILLAYDGHVKVVDFGIARADERETKTQAGVLKGKFAYMAPEQAANAPYDHRVDVFALGSVFWELLTGKQLFGADSPLAILENVRLAVVPSVAPGRADAPPEVDQVLARALARRPEDRYASALEFAEAVSAFLIHENTIFGPRQAGAYMRSLYADDMQHAAALIKQYYAVQPELLDEARSSDTQIFERSTATRPGLPPESTLLVEPPADTQAPLAHTRLTADARRGGTAPGGDEPWIVPVPLVGDPTTLDPPRDAVGELPEEGTLLAPVETNENTTTSAAPRPMPPLDRRQLLVGGSVVMVVLALGALVAELSSGPDAITPAVGVDLPSARPSVSEARGPGAEGDAAHWGWLSVRTSGVAAARVYVDGRDAGYAPVAAFRVRSGKRRIKVVEIVDGRPARARVREVWVGGEHARSAPLEVRIDM